MRFNPSRRHLVRWTGAAALLAWLASCGGGSGNPGAFVVPPATPKPSPDADYVKAVEGLMSTYHPPGILAGVRVAGEAPWTRAFGQADVAQATPLSLNSTFPLRLADLAGNQSGLVDYSMQPGFFEVFIKDTLHVWTPQQLVAFSFAVPPSFLPGEQYQYSNTNTVLLGLVIEAVTGLPLGDVLVAQIFRPLGLTGTSYPSSAALPAPAPTGYAVDIATGAIDDQPLVSPTSLAGSGAIASTLADLLVWGDALGRGTLIGPALQTVRKARARDVTNGPEYDRYGLGIGQIGNWWGHTGSGVGFQVATMYLESRKATVSVMVNASPDGGRRDLNLAQELFEKLAAVVEAA